MNPDEPASTRRCGRGSQRELLGGQRFEQLFVNSLFQKVAAEDDEEEEPL